MVELCAVVSSPAIDCPIEFSFKVNMSAQIGSAGNPYYNAVNPEEYFPLSVILMFDACERRRCVNVTIVDDFDVESYYYERIVYTLERTPGLDSRIDLRPYGRSRIMLNDDESYGLL